MTSQASVTRACLAERALSVLQNATDCHYDDKLGNLLNHLMHWSSLCGFDFDLALARVRHQYEAEVRS